MEYKSDAAILQMVGMDPLEQMDFFLCVLGLSARLHVSMYKLKKLLYEGMEMRAKLF